MIELFKNYLIFENIENILIEYNTNYDDIIKEINEKCKNTILFSTLYDINELINLFNDNINNSIKIVFLRYMPTLNPEKIMIFNNTYQVGELYSNNDFFEYYNFYENSGIYDNAIVPELILNMYYYIKFRLSSIQLIQYMYDESIPITINSYEGEIILSTNSRINRKVRLFYINDNVLKYYESEILVTQLSFLKYDKENWNKFCVINKENPIVEVNVVLLGVLYYSDKDYEIIYSLMSLIENSLNIIDENSVVIVYFILYIENYINKM